MHSKICNLINELIKAMDNGAILSIVVESKYCHTEMVVSIEDIYDYYDQFMLNVSGLKGEISIKVSKEEISDIVQTYENDGYVLLFNNEKIIFQFL